MIVGIDLGTTNSLIGAYTARGPVLFSNALGDLLTPSVVSVDEDGRVIVGQAAHDRLVSHADVSVAAFKRWMGSSRETTLGKRSFRPEELSALLLRSLLADAEAALGEKVTEAVISVPAYFSDAQRKATRAAGELTGIKVERLINEPTAAALAYGLQERSDGGRILVFDLGGGTFDVSILELFDGVVEVHASAGDNFLGGEDFLDLLVQTCCKDARVDPQKLSAREMGLLRHRLEFVKRELSAKGSANLELQLSDQTIQWQIDEDRFSRLSDGLIQRMRSPLERAMRDAKLQPSDLNEIILVGGASRMPLVARIVSRMFGKLPLRHVNPDQAIALGAVTAAGLKARDRQLNEVILTDVCPYTLGTQVSKRDHTGSHQAGFFHPIIHRNSTVPISREDTLFPLSEEQKTILIDVYQGESPLVSKNIKLGELSVPMPRATRTEDQRGVTVRFTYDINGVLQVEATVNATGKTLELLLEQNPGVLSQQEIRARFAALAAIKVHPRDKQENIALLARAERLYEELLDHRETLQEWIARFRSVIESQDETHIRTNSQQLSIALTELESQQ
jgi:molecular chaperone HscC